MIIDFEKWALVVVSAIGFITNLSVFNQSLFAFYGMRLLGINGQTQRDANWARWQDGEKAAAQFLILCLSGWLVVLPQPLIAVERHLEPSYWILMAVSILITSMGIRNLRLRRIQIEEYKERKRGAMRTRDTDCEERRDERLSGV